jgi:UDP-2-acetamido-2-deoxy-ribo-hexuluronate aminotransferase
MEEMESLQAAVLSVKIDDIEKDIEYRNKIAQVYSRELSGVVNIPEILVENNSAWSEYTVRVNNREELTEYLRERKIPFSIKYPIPLSQQEVFRDEVSVYNPVSEKLSEEVISLPVGNSITIESVLEICGAIKDFYLK